VALRGLIHEANRARRDGRTAIETTRGSPAVRGPSTMSTTSDDSSSSVRPAIRVGTAPRLGERQPVENREPFARPVSVVDAVEYPDVLGEQHVSRTGPR
jgi:hypothetical protein